MARRKVDWVTRFESESHHQALVRLVAMHRCISDRLRIVQKNDKRLKVFILVCSAVTSGSLWVLISIAQPQIASWVGASLSTLVAALTLFQLTIGPGKQAEQLSKLYAEFGRSLAHAREYPESFTWHSFKHLESSYVELGLGDPTEEQVRDARVNGLV